MDVLRHTQEKVVSINGLKLDIVVRIIIIKITDYSIIVKQNLVTELSPRKPGAYINPELI